LGKKDWEVVRAMGALAGGLGVNGETCGALIGSLAVLGLRFGRLEPEGREERMLWRYTIELLKRFREEIVQNHGSIRCRDITKIDWMNREQVKSFFKPDEKFLECARIIGDTSKLLGELLERKIKI
jgi:C_GCAxxG_C_C family probable redox protein